MAVILPKPNDKNNVQGDKKTTKYIVTITHDGTTLHETEHDSEIMAHCEYANYIKIESDFRAAHLRSNDAWFSAPTGYYVRVSMECITTVTSGPLVTTRREPVCWHISGDSPTEYEKSVFAAAVKGRR